MALEREREQKMTVEEFFDLIETDLDHRYEYIDGEVYMMTGGKRRHASIITNVSGILRDLMRGKPCRAFTADAYVRLSGTRYVCPDAVVSCDPRDGDSGNEEDEMFVRYPCLIVEVLSTHSKSRDRVKKVRLYEACPTIQEYLIIASESPTVWLYQRQANGTWVTHMFGLEKSIELISINARIPVADLYEKTQFYPHNES